MFDLKNNTIPEIAIQAGPVREAAAELGTQAAVAIPLGTYKLATDPVPALIDTAGWPSTLLTIITGTVTDAQTLTLKAGDDDEGADLADVVAADVLGDLATWKAVAAGEDDTLVTLQYVGANRYLQVASTAAGTTGATYTVLASNGGDAVLAAAATPEALIDCANCSTVLLTLNIGAVADAQALTVKHGDLADGSDLADVTAGQVVGDLADFKAIADDESGAVKTLAYKVSKRYLKVACAADGTDGATFSVTAQKAGFRFLGSNPALP